MKPKDFEQQEPIQDNGTAEMDLNVDDNVAGTNHLNEPVGTENEVEALNQKIADLNDKYLRQVAEFDNFRRRTAKERIDLIQTAGREVITAMLDVLDDSERAQQQLEKTDDVVQIKEGVGLVFNKLKTTLTAKGLKPMDAQGQDFDPDKHEAITEIEAGPQMKGKVVDEVQKGYYLGDKIIRFAKVVVGK